MARPISDEELQLKKRARRRLVGAVVLVSAVAVLLPMVLDSEPKPASRKVDIHIPPSDSSAYKSSTNAASAQVSEPSTPKPSTATVQNESAAPAVGTQPSGTEAAPAAANADASVSTAESSISAPVAVPPPIATARPQSEAGKPPPAEAKPAPVTATKDHAKVAARDDQGPSRDSASGSFVVQVAALADAARVKQLQKQMASAGVKTYTEVVSTKAGHVTRVRAGPYSSREAAEKARTQLKKVGLDGKVVSR
jgi:DedD protein